MGLLTGQMSAKERRALDYILVGSWQVVGGYPCLMSKAVDYADLRLAGRRAASLQGPCSGRPWWTRALRCTPWLCRPRPFPAPCPGAVWGYGRVGHRRAAPGREPIKTHLVSPAKREGMYGFIRGLTERGKQAYVVCPRVGPAMRNPGAAWAASA